MVGSLLGDRGKNKMRKNFKIITLIIIIFVLSSLNVPAHPGRTDANGGHWNHSTGEYHYHSGEYAGKNKSSSSSSTKNKSTPKESKYDKLFEEDDEESVSSVQEDLSNKKQKNYTWLIIIGGIILLFAGFGIIDAIRENLSNKKKEETQPTELDMSMIPEGIGIDHDMLPYIVNRKYGYGKKFNAFVIRDNHCYHSSKCPHLKGKPKIVIHRYVAMNKYAPCSHCTPKCFVDDWYITFIKKNNIEDKYEILNFTNNNNK